MQRLREQHKQCVNKYTRCKPRGSIAGTQLCHSVLQPDTVQSCAVQGGD